MGIQRPKKNRNKKYQDVKTVVHTSEDDEGHKSIIQIIFTTILQTGEYACYYNDISAPLYIFVNDDSHLLLPLNYFPFLTLHEGVPSVIPCLPTVSSANVSLWKVKQPIVEKLELNDGLKYDFTEGFLLRNPTNFFKGNFYCSAEYQNRSENLTLNIDVLLCKVKIKLGTNINRPKWSFQLLTKKKSFNRRPVIRKTTIHRMISETLTVTEVQKSDEGIYQCNVTDHSNRENYHEVEVKVYENVQQPVINFTKAVDRIVEIQGENVDLIATFTVFLLLQIFAPLGPKTATTYLASTKYILKPSDSVFILEILNLSRSDAGIYTVTAHTSGRTFNKSFHLYVKDTPVVKVQNSSCCFIPGHAYQLQCESNGYPIPNLSWKWAPMVDCSGVACDDKRIGEILMKPEAPIMIHNGS
ncbi:hypothetical protein CEXT_503691 [Caerostris extrusa]|uniref:Platelet-derived growth factor receptor-like protein n=1 Tax=Caerostris extrusa TaxID=172846 RepID=A0AAV4PEK3_CAEEX|nr:hypothetical protein CEXT_503691 [Caerostris extrusa]